MEEGGARLREAPRLALPLRGDCSARGNDANRPSHAENRVPQPVIRVALRQASPRDAQHGEAAAEAARKAGGATCLACRGSPWRCDAT